MCIFIEKVLINTRGINPIRKTSEDNLYAILIISLFYQSLSLYTLVKQDGVWHKNTWGHVSDRPLLHMIHFLIWGWVLINRPNVGRMYRMPTNISEDSVTGNQWFKNIAWLSFLVKRCIEYCAIPQDIIVIQIFPFLNNASRNYLVCVDFTHIHFSYTSCNSCTPDRNKYFLRLKLFPIN